MFKLCIVFALIFATSYAAPERAIFCGKTPRILTICLDLQPAVSPEIQEKCRRANECERLTCTFREYNLFDGAVVRNNRTAAFLDDFGKQYPVWESAIDHAKAACLRTSGLKPQGVYLDCPAYDIIHCVFTNLIKHAPPSQWSPSPECNRTRTFVAACPICPDECFSPQKPISSCNACLVLSRSP